VLVLAAVGSSVTGCAKHHRGLNVQVVETRDDRWATMVGEDTIVVYAAPRLRAQVELLFDYLAELNSKGLEMDPGYRLHFGWTTLTLTEQRGEFVFHEPDYDAADPEGATREDISATLDVFTSQHAVLMLAQRRPEPVNFDQHVLVSRGALEQSDVYLVRVQSPGSRLTGWRIAPTEGDVSAAEVDSMPVHALYKQRPDLLAAMLLPAGFMAFFDADGLGVIVDEHNQPVWKRAIPAGSEAEFDDESEAQSPPSNAVDEPAHGEQAPAPAPEGD